MQPSMHVQSYNDWLTEGFNFPYDTDRIFESLMKLNKAMLLILIKVFAGTMPFPQFVMMGYSKSDLVHMLIGYMDDDPAIPGSNGKGKGKGNVIVLPQPHGGNMAQFQLYYAWLENGIGDNFVLPLVDKGLKLLDRTTLLILIHVVSAGVHPLLQQMDHAKAQLISTLMEYMVHDNDGLVSKGKGKGGPPPPAPPPQQQDDDDDDYIIETNIIQQEGGDQQQQGEHSDDSDDPFLQMLEHFDPANSASFDQYFVVLKGSGKGKGKNIVDAVLPDGQEPPSHQDGDDQQEEGALEEDSDGDTFLKPIIIVPQNGEPFPLMVRFGWSVDRIKGKIRDVIGRPKWQQALAFMGSEMIDNRTLNSYGITEDTHLQLRFPLDAVEAAHSQ